MQKTLVHNRTVSIWIGYRTSIFLSSIIQFRLQSWYLHDYMPSDDTRPTNFLIKKPTQSFINITYRQRLVWKMTSMSWQTYKGHCRPYCADILFSDGGVTGALGLAYSANITQPSRNCKLRIHESVARKSWEKQINSEITIKINK